MASAKPPKQRTAGKRAAVGVWKVIQTVTAGLQGEHLEGLGYLDRVQEDELGPPPAVAKAEDPLTFHAEAIPHCLPIQLRQIAAAAFPGGSGAAAAKALLRLGGAASVEEYLNRVWCTALCVAWLEDQEHSFQKDLVNELTIVDAASAWLKAQEGANPAIAEAMPVVREKAKYRVAIWFIVQDERISRARRATNTFRFHLNNLLMRLTAFVGHALRIRHELLSAFFGPLLFEGLRKWQRWVLVVTCVLVAFVIEVWFYWNRGTLCCAEIRAILQCPGTFLDPCRRARAAGVCRITPPPPLAALRHRSLSACRLARAFIVPAGSHGGFSSPDFARRREFQGDCADLEEQFKDLLAELTGSKEEYVCHQARARVG